MKKLILFFLPIALFIRVFLINEIPPGLTNDELNIGINAQSLITTGQNIPGVVTGILGKTSGDLSLGIHSELGSLLIAPFIKIFGFSILSVKLPFILASIGIVIVGYLLTEYLINSRAAIYAGILLGINPWLIFYGRAVYESILSSFFYMLAVFVILKLRGWKKFYSVIFLLAAFLSYFSAKTMLIPITLFTSIFAYFLEKKHSLKPLIILNIFIFLFVGLYSLVLVKTPAGARMHELSLIGTTAVNAKRTASLNSALTPIFENKIVEDLRTRLSASLAEFNLSYLFLNGQPESTTSLSIPDHGFMYLIDLPLIALAFLFGLKKNRGVLLFITSILLTTFIPNFLNLQGTTYSIRTVVLFPMLTILSAIGLYSIKNRLIKSLTILLYFFFVCNFLYIYFNRLPVERSEGWFLPQRLVSRYVSETVSNNPSVDILLISPEPKLMFYKYLFYTGSYDGRNNVAEINAKIASEDYSIGKIKITDECQPKNVSENQLIMADTKANCQIQQNATIKNINDAGDRYTISTDILCKNYPKTKYPLIKNASLLNIEGISVEDFCKNYVSDSL